MYGAELPEPSAYAEDVAGGGVMMKRRTGAPKPTFGARRASRAGDPTGPPHDYKDRLLRYIPAETIALYLTLQQIIKAFPDSPQAALWAAVGFGALLTLVYMLKTSKSEKGSIDWPQVLVATAAFGVWTLALGDPYDVHPVWPAIALPAFTGIAPWVLK